MGTNRIEWIDIAKGMAIFLMVCGHTSIPMSLSNWIWSFHMPLFFIVSGILFSPEHYQSFKEFMVKRCRTLLVPWIFFTLVLVLFSPSNSYRMLREGHNLFALWFLPVLFVVEMIGYGIIKITKDWCKIIVAICIASLGFILGKYQISFPFDVDVSLYATLFYVVGLVERHNILNIKAKWKWIGILLLVNVVLSVILPRTDMAENKCGIFGVNAINAFIGTAAFFLLAKQVENAKILNIVRRFFLWAGNNTIVILGLSQVVNLLLKQVMENSPLPNALSSAFRHILLWVILWLLAFILNRYMPEFIGKKRNNK